MVVCQLCLPPAVVIPACRLGRQESSRIGVQQLRRFLEALLQRRYLDSIPVIVPLLDREARSVSGRLDAAKKELAGLAIDKLKVGEPVSCAYALNSTSNISVSASCTMLMDTDYGSQLIERQMMDASVGFDDVR